MYFSTTFIVSIMSLETVSYPNEEQLSFQKSTKKRLTPKRSFKFVADYDTAEEAKQFMEEHGSYSVVRTYNVKSGIRTEKRAIMIEKSEKFNTYFVKSTIYIQ